MSSLGDCFLLLKICPVWLVGFLMVWLRVILALGIVISLIIIIPCFVIAVCSIVVIKTVLSVEIIIIVVVVAPISRLTSVSVLICRIVGCARSVCWLLVRCFVVGIGSVWGVVP